MVASTPGLIEDDRPSAEGVRQRGLAKRFRRYFKGNHLRERGLYASRNGFVKFILLREL
jgi:hypothetical protein